jgi:hypothetical protein
VLDGVFDFVSFPEHAALRDRLLALTSPDAVSACVVIPGVTASGKTVMADWFRARMRAAGVAYAHDVSFSRYGPIGLLTSLLDSLDDRPTGEKHKDLEVERQPEDLLQTFVSMMRERNLRVIVIDNADGLLRNTTPATSRAVQGLLTTLVLQHGARIVLLGLPTLRSLQLRPLGKLQEMWPLGPVGDSPELRTALRALLTAPRRRPSGPYGGLLDDDVVVERLLDAGGGFAGFVLDLARDILSDGAIFVSQDRGPWPHSLLDRIDVAARHDLVPRVLTEWRATSW